MKFELLVAIRYLKAKRKQAAISLITVISVVGVAAGVAALIIALAVNAGFAADLQSKLIGAQAHITIHPKDGAGISNYIERTKQVAQVPGVIAAAPSVYDKVLLSKGSQLQGAVIKGIIPEMESQISALSQNVVQGDLKHFDDHAIVLGQDLANSLGASVGDRIQVMSSQEGISPMGAIPTSVVYHVVAIFSSGFYDTDSNWVYVPIASLQQLLRLPGDVASAIEVKVQNVLDAGIIGQQLVDKLGGNLEFDTWMTLNKSIFHALALERLVMFITIGLIVIVAALNIVATLIMMVLEKTRDIAILMSMGATRENIRRIFILQGLIIGVVGTAFGVVIGRSVSFVFDKYRLISLAPEIYTIPYVPFHARLMDTVIVASVAILISFLATLYPSLTASRLHPVEALRYE